MTPEKIDQFFEILASELKAKATILLTGGAAALLLGGERPTMDIDFAITTKTPWDQLTETLTHAETLSHVHPHYAEDIDRWSSITFLDYRKHTRPYKTFGKLIVRILEPEYWSIGKMARYYDSDVSDMIAVFKTQNTPADRLQAIWQRALEKSPRSDALFQFKTHVRHFLKTHGKTIWGKAIEKTHPLFVW